MDPGVSWGDGLGAHRDVVTLRACTPIPTFEKRLVIHAERVEATSLG